VKAKFYQRSLERAIYVAVAAGLVVLFNVTLQMAPPMLPGYPGDAFFPRLVIGFTAIPVLIGLAQSFTRRRQPGVKADDNLVEIDIGGYLVAILVGLGFAGLMPILGFEITCTVIMAGLLLPRMGWGTRQTIHVLGIAMFTMLVFYVSFVLILGIHLPLYFLPKYVRF
jgi:hypothetical protein